MTRASLRRFVPLVSVLLAILLVTLGTMPVGANLWNVGDSTDLDIGANETQTIPGVQTFDTSSPVHIHIGEVVDAGAKLNDNSSSYWVTSGGSKTNEGVYIEDPQSPSAKIIIEPNAVETSGFDVIISGVDTTSVGIDVGSESSVDIGIEYQIIQSGITARSQFQLRSDANVHIQSYDGLNNQVNLANVSLDNPEQDYLAIWELDTDGQLYTLIGSQRGQEGNFSVDVDEIHDDTRIAATIHPESDGTDTQTVYAIDDHSVSVPIQLATQYQPMNYISNTGSTGETDQQVLEIVFNTPIAEQGNTTIEFTESSEVIVNLVNNTNHVEISKNRLRISPGALVTDDSTFQRIGSVTLDNIKPKNDGSGIDSQTYAVQNLDRTLSSGSNISVSSGEMIGFETETDKNFSVTVSQNESNFTLDSEPGQEVIPFNTTNLETGEYLVESPQFEHDAHLWIVDLDLDLSVGNESIWTDEPFILSVDSNIPRQHLVLAIENENKTIISEKSVSTDKSIATDVSVDIPEPGQYSLIITDPKSGVRSVETVQVTNPEPPSFELDDQSNSIGSVLPLAIHPSSFSNTTILTITDPTGEYTMTASITTPRAETVAIGFNTYLAGDPDREGDLLTLDGSGTIDSLTATAHDGPLPAGEYTVTARAGPTGPTDTKTMTLHPRTTDSLTVYTNTTATDQPTLATAASIVDAIANGTLSPAESVAENETVVFGLTASGLSGYLASRETVPSTGADVDDLAGLGFEVATTPENDTESTVRSTAAGTELYTHDDGLFLVGIGNETLAPDTDTDDPETDPTAPETELVATVTVLDERLRDAASDSTTEPDPSHTATAPLTYTTRAEPDGSAGSDEPGDTGDGGDAEPPTDTDDESDTEEPTDTDGENDAGGSEETDTEDGTDANDGDDDEQGGEAPADDGSTDEGATDEPGSGSDDPTESDDRPSDGDDDSSADDDGTEDDDSSADDDGTEDDPGGADDSGTGGDQTEGEEPVKGDDPAADEPEAGNDPIEDDPIPDEGPADDTDPIDDEAPVGDDDAGAVDSPVEDGEDPGADGDSDHTDGEGPFDDESPAGPEEPVDDERPADGEDSVAGDDPVDTENPSDNADPIGGDDPSNGESPANGDKPGRENGSESGGPGSAPDTPDETDGSGSPGIPDGVNPDPDGDSPSGTGSDVGGDGPPGTEDPSPAHGTDQTGEREDSSDPDRSDGTPPNGSSPDAKLGSPPGSDARTNDTVAAPGVRSAPGSLISDIGSATGGQHPLVRLAGGERPLRQVAVSNTTSSTSATPELGSEPERVPDDVPASGTLVDNEPPTDIDGTPEQAPRPPGLDEAPLRSTAYDVPGFDISLTLLALGLAVGTGVRLGRR